MHEMFIKASKRWAYFLTSRNTVQSPVPVNINSVAGNTALKQECQMQNLQVWDITEHA